jgi:iron complex outermembrane receptor protein
MSGRSGARGRGRRRARLIASTLAAAFPLLHAGGARADEETIEELSLEDMLGVVEGVTRFEEPVARAPAAVTIIAADEIARSGARDLIDLLRYVVGVHVVSHTGDSHSVGMRGLDELAGNSVVLLIDGHHFTNVFDGETDWSALPVTLDDIERIEVVRGPVSVMYGANASGGVVNVVRKGDGSATLSTYRVLAGAPMSYQLTARLVQKFDRVFTKISARHSSAPVDETLSEDAPRMTTFDAAAWWKMAPGRQLEAAVGSSVGVGDRVTPLFPAPIRLTTINLMQSASYTHAGALTTGDELSVRQSLHHRSLDPALGASPSDDLQHLQYRKIDGEASYRAQVTESFEAAVSGSLRHVEVDSPAITERASLPFYAAGVTAGFRPAPRFELRGGARLDYNEFVIRPKPSFRGAASFAITDHHLVRAAVGTAFRHPTFAEAIGLFQDPQSQFIYLVGAGTDALRPPEVTSGALGYRGRLVQGLTADITLFGSRSRGNIEQEHRSVPSTFVNGDDQDQGGLEAELRYSAASAYATAGYSVVHAFDGPMDTPPGHSAYLSAGGTLPWGVRGDVRASFSSLRRYQTLVGVPASLLQIDIDPVLLAAARAAYAVPGTQLTLALQLAGWPLLAERESPYPTASKHEAHGYATLQFDY